MDNIEQFSLYTAKIFKELYDSFPMPISIDPHNLITDCLSFNKHDELQDLKNKQDMGSLLILASHNSGKDKIEEQLLRTQEKYSELESEKSSEIRCQTNIFNSTLKFLISEGLIRTPEGGGYVLTAKAFSHLNKNFEGEAENNKESSYIKIIKRIFSRTAETTEKIGIGMAVKVIPTLLGIS